MANFARQLERELSAAQANIAVLEQKRREAVRKCAELCGAYGLELGDKLYKTSSRRCEAAIHAAFPDAFEEKDNEG